MQATLEMADTPENAPAAPAPGWRPNADGSIPQATRRPSIERRPITVAPIDAASVVEVFAPATMIWPIRGLAWRLVATALGALVGVQFPLPWGGLLGALVAAMLVDYLLGLRLSPQSWLHLTARGAIGCVVGTSLVPALATPTLLHTALWPVGLLAACWLGGAALIAIIGRVDLGTALRSPALTRGEGARRYLVFGLQQARGVGLLLLAAWLTQ
jgi:hypothetical protein